MANKFSKRLLLFSAIATLSAILAGITFVPSAKFGGVLKANNFTQFPTNSSQADVDRVFELTAQQRQEIFDLIHQRTNQIDDILTASQKTQLEQALKSGQNYDQVLESLNLTPEQEQQIKSVNNAAEVEIKQIATES